MVSTLRGRVTRVFVLVAATLGLAIGFMPAQASASPILNPHPSCNMPQVPPTGGHDWFVGDTKMGTLYVYYSAANGGTNCLWFQKNYHRGTPSPTFVDIGVCGATPSTPCTVKDKNDGSFKYYAGPVRATGTANRCIDSVVKIEGYSHRFGPFHCD